MRVPAPLAPLALAVALAACARTYGTGSSMMETESISPQPALVKQVAAQQLTARGYSVADGGGLALVTAPRPIPDSLRSRGLKGRLYIVQITADTNAFASGTDLHVAAYVVPDSAAAGAGRSVTENAGTEAVRVSVDSADQRAGTRTFEAIPVTEEDAPLYREVRRITRSIARASNVQAAAAMRRNP